MQANRVVVSLVVLSLALVAGCGGGGSSVTPPPPGSSSVSVAIRDVPPTGVTVLSFEVTLSGAVLNPGNVDLLAGRGPIKVEVKRLEVETAFLSTANVPAGTYNSITLNLANPELTIKNDSANPIGTCPNTPPINVCEFKPNTAGAVTFSGAPFPLTIGTNSPTGLLLDLNLNNIITGTLGVDFNAAGGVTVLQLPLPGQPTGQLEEVEDLVGKVANKGTDTFDLRMANHTITGIKVDNNTKFEDFNEDVPPCTASPQNFSCVKNDQIVEVDIRLMAGGMLVAKKIELEDEPNRDEVEGVIVRIGAGTPPTQFDMVALDHSFGITGLEVGSKITVNIQGGAGFRVDDDDLIIPAGLVFLSSTDLLVGQHVQVRRLTSSSGTNINTDRVRLRMSRFTAKVKSKSGSDFNVDNLPSLFTSASPAINEIRVRTSTQTNFQDVSGVTGLNVPPNADTVSLRGLLFKTLGIPDLVAKKVRKR